MHRGPTLTALATAAVAAALAAGCSSAPQPSAARSESAVTASPDYGSSADRSCQVILRQAFETYEGRTGPVTDCSSGTCWVVVQGAVDISEAAMLAEDAPSISWQGTASTTWNTAALTPVGGAGTGYRRYAFALHADTFTADGSNGVAGPMQLVPLLSTPQATLFDHNRNPGDLANYVLDVSNNWTIAEDDATCADPTPPGAATLHFTADFQQSVTGSLVAGGKVTVAYDLSRLPQCMGESTDGEPVWDTEAHVRFFPSNQEADLPMRGPQDPTTFAFTSLPVELDVPAGTTSLSTWFSTSGEGCSTYWDSNYSANYPFAVTP
jgi:hypothetical protein